MNRARRSTLRKIIKTLSELESQGNDGTQLDELRRTADSIGQVREKEQECLDNIDDLNEAWTDMPAVTEIYGQHNGHDNPYKEVKAGILSVISYCTRVIER